VALSTIDHFMSCSVAALNGVSAQSPEATLKQYLETLKEPKYDSTSKSYKPIYKYHWHIHVFFSGPDMRTLKPAGQLGGDHHYSDKGSCDRFAAFLRENNLGEVIESPPRWNHRHKDTRKPGEGDVIAYIWSPDAKALEAWHLANKEQKPKGVVTI
jgi:hypothetical protein